MGALGSENTRWLPATHRRFVAGCVASRRQCQQLVLCLQWMCTIGILSVCKAPAVQKLNQHFEVVMHGSWVNSSLIFFLNPAVSEF